MEQPLVSVIMPAYNSEKYIGQAIESVIAQTYSSWELIVVDDCSADRSRDIARELANKDKRIKPAFNDENCGAAKSRNKGIEIASGKYIALLDSDDIWLPKKLEQQINLAEHTDADIIYCSYALIDADGKRNREEYIVPEAADFNLMLMENVIGCSTVMAKANVLKSHPFSEDFYHEDYALWLQLLGEGYTATGITEVLSDYRMINTSRSGNKLNSAKQRWQIYRKALKMSLLDSAGCFMKYAVNGIKKYYL